MTKLKFKSMERIKPTIVNVHPVQAISKWKFIGFPEIMRKCLIGAGISLIAIYVSVNIKQIFAPPSIRILTPVDGIVSKNTETLITGITEPEVLLKINGKTITPDRTGNFQDTIELEPGLNTIVIVGSKKYSSPITLTRRIFVDDSGAPFLSEK